MDKYANEAGVAFQALMEMVLNKAVNPLKRKLEDMEAGQAELRAEMQAGQAGLRASLHEMHRMCQQLVDGFRQQAAAPSEDVDDNETAGLPLGDATNMFVDVKREEEEDIGNDDGHNAYNVNDGDVNDGIDDNDSIDDTSQNEGDDANDANDNDGGAAATAYGGDAELAILLNPSEGPGYTCNKRFVVLVAKLAGWSLETAVHAPSLPGRGVATIGVYHFDLGKQNGALIHKLANTPDGQLKNVYPDGPYIIVIDEDGKEVKSSCKGPCTIRLTQAGLDKAFIWANKMGILIPQGV